MTRIWRAWALTALFLWLGVGPSLGESDPEHRVLASGQLRSGHIYRDRFRRLLGVTALEHVQVLDATLEGYQFTSSADLDLHVENTLTPDALVDFTNRIRAQYASPDDILGGRYSNLDNRFQAVWGLALDTETTMKTDLLVRTHYDVLFPKTNATSGDLSLTLDTALDHDSWLTFGFTGDATAFGEDESPDYFEGLARLAYQWNGRRRVRTIANPSPVDYPQQPEPEGAPDAFRYGKEAGLYESKKLFPLGRESLIGRAAPAPLVVSANDRLFREEVDANSGFGELEFAFRARDYRTAAFSDWRRAEINASYAADVAAGLVLDVSNQFHFAEYADPADAAGQTDRFGDRFRVELVRTRADSRFQGYGAIGVYRFPSEKRLDLDFFELGYTSLQRFGRRYWLYSDATYVGQIPDTASASYPERNQTIGTLGFTVDFTPLNYLTLSGRTATLRIPKFETFFDFGYSDSTAELRYHHQIKKLYALEAGVRGMRRYSENQHNNDRRETLVFFDTILEL